MCFFFQSLLNHAVVVASFVVRMAGAGAVVGLCHNSMNAIVCLVEEAAKRFVVQNCDLHLEVEVEVEEVESLP